MSDDVSLQRRMNLRQKSNCLGPASFAGRECWFALVRTGEDQLPMEAPEGEEQTRSLVTLKGGSRESSGVTIRGFMTKPKLSLRKSLNLGRGETLTGLNPRVTSDRSTAQVGWMSRSTKRKLFPICADPRLDTLPPSFSSDPIGIKVKEIGSYYR